MVCCKQVLARNRFDRTICYLVIEEDARPLCRSTRVRKSPSFQGHQGSKHPSFSWFTGRGGTTPVGLWLLQVATTACGFGVLQNARLQRVALLSMRQCFADKYSGFQPCGTKGTKVCCAVVMRLGSRCLWPVLVVVCLMSSVMSARQVQRVSTTGCVLRWVCGWGRGASGLCWVCLKSSVMSARQVQRVATMGCVVRWLRSQGCGASG